jgi:AraC family transcriptional regulator, regulatory protein of adaptative response / methylated-DNA-[protein]-cysteine methyltransferase
MSTLEVPMQAATPLVFNAVDEARWAAVVAHDRRQDGRFFYAVKTTGIYCRPSCPSRRPKERDNVQFFEDHVSAERAGFRACLRCKPRETSAQMALLERVCAILRSAEELVSLDALAAKCGVSPFHLQRTFKRLMGVSPRQYQQAQRVQRFKEELTEGTTVTDAIYAAGYGSSSRAYERSQEQLGMTPAQYRHAGLGMNISFTIFESDLGKVLIAATEKGVCSLRIGDDGSMLADELRNEFRAANIRRDDASLQAYANSVLAYFSGASDCPDLPLDVKATAFQARVWQALRAIPRGETRTYSEVADELGVPSAVRAVARACATNPVALTVPCHRVVRKGGELSGYRWGVERKRELLKRERVHN